MGIFLGSTIVIVGIFMDIVLLLEFYQESENFPAYFSDSENISRHCRAIRVLPGPGIRVGILLDTIDSLIIQE